MPAMHYKFPWRTGNRFETLIDSTVFFPRMLAAIDAAEKYILLEMYLIESGVVANRFIEALLEAAERGVRICLLLDDFGAVGLKRRDRARLAHQNIRLTLYNPLPSYSLLHNLYRIVWKHATVGLYRDHRKLLLVDGLIAFTGGTGITDAVDSPRAPARRWRETMIAIEGTALADWQQLFIESWNLYAPEKLVLPDITATPPENGQTGRVTVNEARRRMGIQRSLHKHIKYAQQRIWFATAYFIPSWTLRRKLKQAARRGVDVRLLMPGPITDHPGARYASHRYYGRLLKSGLRIFEFRPRFFHAKTVLCDDWVSIGSCNFDRWNLQWNLEANQEINDAEMADAIADMFAKDFADSREYTADEWSGRSWYHRSLEWFWQRVERLSLRIRHRR